jgi:hypothetical protein
MMSWSNSTVVASQLYQCRESLSRFLGFSLGTERSLICPYRTTPAVHREPGRKSLFQDFLYYSKSGGDIAQVRAQEAC